MILFFTGAIIRGFMKGFAGVNGMLRRTLYGKYFEFMLGAMAEAIINGNRISSIFL